MIDSIEFTNFKALRQVTLPLAPLTLILGPNGSGKSSVLDALQRIALWSSSAAQQDGRVEHQGEIRSSLVSVTAAEPGAPVSITVRMKTGLMTGEARFAWRPDGWLCRHFTNARGSRLDDPDVKIAQSWLSRMRIFTFDSDAIAEAVPVTSAPMQQNGAGLAAVLDRLRDNHDERWQAFLREMREWLPEYDGIQFDIPTEGCKSLVLRTRKGDYRIPAKQLSQGTCLFSATLPFSPSIRTITVS